MSVFIWITVSLFLLQRFPSAAESVEYSHLIVRLGDEATLPCGTMMNVKLKCEGIMWLHSASGQSSAVRAFKRGRISETKPGRLGLTEDCSLVITNVMAQDVGIYTCRELTPQWKGRDSQVQLAVVSITEEKKDNKVSLHCSVMDVDPCSRTAEWLHVDQDGKTILLQLSLPSCTQSVLTLHDDFISTYRDLLKCKVTDPYGSKVHMFDLRPSSSGEDSLKSTAETELTTSPTMSSAAPQYCRCSALDYAIFLMHLAEVFLVIFIAFLFFRARGKDKGVHESVLKSATGRPENHSGSEMMSPDEEDTEDYVNFRSPASAANLNVQHEHHIR